MTKSCIEEMKSGSYSAMAAQTAKRSEHPEAEIIRRAQSGDADAFEHLYRRHSRRVYAICLRMTGNSSSAEDLTQEVFLHVFRKIHTFRGTSAFSTWLYRVAFNTVLMNCRKKRLKEVPLEEASEAEDSISPIAQIAAEDARAPGLLERLMLKNAVQELPRGYRRILLMHDVLGYQHHEIANALRCSDGTSKSQLFKARMCLRRMLESGFSTTRELVANKL